MSIITAICTRDISRSVILTNEVVPPYIHPCHIFRIRLSAGRRTLYAPLLIIRCDSFRYSATSHSMPLLFSTRSSVCPYVRTVSIRLTACGYTLFASFAMFVMACGTWKFNHRRFRTSLNRVIVCGSKFTASWKPPPRSRTISNKWPLTAISLRLIS